MNTDTPEDLPFNGLATSSDIIDEQMKRLGLYPSDFDETTAAPTVAPGASDPTTPTPQQQQALVYDGPADTKKTLGKMLEEYGIPTSASDLLSAAESAVIDIPRELGDAKEPVWTILTRDDRLMGMGALLIIVAGIMALISLLR